jgi:hypothetical protein
MSDLDNKDTVYADEKGRESQSDTEEQDVLPKEKTPEETKLVRKLDARILPITCLLYLFACTLLRYFKYIPFQKLTFLSKIWIGPTSATLAFKVYPVTLCMAILLVICSTGLIQYSSFHM